MKDCGFIIYDIVEPLYRPVDFALWQVDTIFVKKDGKFRQFQGYANEATMKHIHDSDS